MVKFMNEKRLESINIYGGRNFRRYTLIFNLNNRPTRQAVCAIVDKFESAFSLFDIPVAMRCRTVQSDENILAVSVSIENEPNQSMLGRSQE